MIFNQKLFTEKVSTHRKYQQLSMRSAAKKIGISASTLSRIEAGSPPDIESYCKLCRWMMITSDYFIKQNSK